MICWCVFFYCGAYSQSASLFNPFPSLPPPSPPHPSKGHPGPGENYITLLPPLLEVFMFHSIFTNNTLFIPYVANDTNSNICTPDVTVLLSMQALQFVLLSVSAWFQLLLLLLHTVVCTAAIPVTVVINRNMIKAFVSDFTCYCNSC